MKKIHYIPLLGAILLAALPFTAMAHTEADPYVTNLIAGGGNGSPGTDAGDVLIWNDTDNLFVKFETAGSWCLLSTSVAVGNDVSDIPHNQAKNPKVGQFEFSAQYALVPCVKEQTFEVPLADHDLVVDDIAYIAAHADLVNTYNNQHETGWGAGIRFNNNNWAMYIGDYVVQASIIPTPGTDIVVYNDINVFDNTGTLDLSNQLMIANLVNYTNSNPRGSQTHVIFDRGRSSVCAGTGECSDASMSTMRTVITTAGFTIDNISSNSGDLATIPANVKVIFLWNPLVPYTVNEVNAFKQFAKDGGRVVFVGEWDGYYGSGIALENQFLLDMGAVMTNSGGALDCGYTLLPGTSLRPHQITTGMTDVTVACASVIVPGPQDYPFIYDSTNTSVLAGVAKIDTTPLMMIAPPAPALRLSQPAPNSGLNAAGVPIGH